MATPKDLYAILGLPRTASADDIRKAYRKLARKYHPDVNAGNKEAEETFKDVSLAYDVLSNADKRRLYDEFGADSLQSGFDPQRAREYRRWSESGHGFQFRREGGQPGGGPDFGFEFPPRGRRMRRTAGEDERGFADILNEMFGGGGGGGRTAEEEAPSRDIEHPLEVDMLDALRGTQTSVTVRRPVTCPTCKGTGRSGRRACTECGGSGAVEKREKLTVKIPAGVGDGARVRVAGKGGQGAGGAAGDLYFIVKVRPHPRIQRDGKDLTIDVPVTVREAVQGASITVPTPTGGRVQLKVQPGSQSGQRLRLRGRGAPDPKGGEAGDLYVRLMVQVPTATDGAALDDALAAIERAYPENPRAHLEL